MSRKCKVCRAEFTPTKPLQCVCGLQCALSLATLAKAKRERSQAVQERRETKAKLEKLKRRGDWIKDAQTEFNKYVRLRDMGKGCISCGSAVGRNSPGGDGDAGHFRSRGSAPHLRFDERNCHLQCKRCNRYLSGNVAYYRIGLINRIGLEAVNALECDQAPRNHTVDDLKAIRDMYRAKAKELEKSNA